MTQTRTTTPSTPMPTIKVELGKYVTVRPRADGTSRVLFEVPPRLRPSGWSPATPLPLDPDLRTGRLGAAEVEAIQQDAKALYEKLTATRAGREVGEDPKARTFKKLDLAWKASENWPTNRKTQEGYELQIAKILRWAKAHERQPDPTKTTVADIAGALALHKDTPTTRKHLLKVWRLMMDQAIALGWRSDNPARAKSLRVRVPKTKVTPWEQDDVDLYVAKALEPGHYGHDRKSLALIILLEWEIGQRLTDVRGFRPGAEYDTEAGVFRFWQSKTGSYVTVPVSLKLRELLNEAADGGLFLFRHEGTGKAYTEERLSKSFAWLRKAVVKAGGRHLVLRALRHSCIVQLARSGCTSIEIAAITGHSVASVDRILSIYLPRDNQVAWNAQKKRGVVK